MLVKIIILFILVYLITIMHVITFYNHIYIECLYLLIFINCDNMNNNKQMFHNKKYQNIKIINRFCFNNLQ
jgi:hypothetical protein